MQPFTPCVASRRHERCRAGVLRSGKTLYVGTDPIASVVAFSAESVFGCVRAAWGAGARRGAVVLLGGVPAVVGAGIPAPREVTCPRTGLLGVGGPPAGDADLRWGP